MGVVMMDEANRSCDPELSAQDLPDAAAPVVVDGCAEREIGPLQARNPGSEAPEPGRQLEKGAMQVAVALASFEPARPFSDLPLNLIFR